MHLSRRENAGVQRRRAGDAFRRARSRASARAAAAKLQALDGALLLWRARTLAAVADPELEVDEPTDPCVVDEARRETNEPTTIPNVTERPAREVRKVPPAKRRRLPPSLAQSAAARGGGGGAREETHRRYTLA